MLTCAMSDVNRDEGPVAILDRNNSVVSVVDVGKLIGTFRVDARVSAWNRNLHAPN